MQSTLLSDAKMAPALPSTNRVMSPISQVITPVTVPICKVIGGVITPSLVGEYSNYDIQTSRACVFSGSSHLLQASVAKISLPILV